MSKSKPSVLIYTPMHPRNTWRGEGIAQTIENIITHGSGAVEYHVVCNKKHYSDIWEIISASYNRENIKVFTIGFNWVAKEKSYTIHDLTRMKNKQSKCLGGRWLGKFTRASETLLWAFSILVFIARVRFRASSITYDVIWLPTTHTLFNQLLKGKQIVSFWDPFVFEHNGFKNANSLFYLIMRNLLKSDVIVTQSDFNKRYLSSVTSIKEAQISVVPNGSPDYSKYLKEFSEVKNGKVVEYLKNNIKVYSVSRLLDFHINLSILNRLLESLSSKTKVIFISTQYRLYKGFDVLFELLNLLVKQCIDTYDFRFIFSAETIPDRLLYRYSVLDNKVFCISRVPERFHAALYYVSDLVLHPSHVEGGIGTYPQFEATSLNVPCLNNLGRHMREFGMKLSPQELSEVACDFDHFETTIQKIMDLIDNKVVAKNNINITRKGHIPWSEAAQNYELLFKKAVK